MANSDQSGDYQYSDRHNEDYHRNYLTKLCRLCSSRLNSAKQNKEKTGRVYNVQNYAVAIKTEFNIDVTEDKPGTIHPSNFCNKCRNAMTNFKRNPNSKCNVIKRQDVLDINCRWNTVGENISSCFTCHTYTHQTKRGPRKTPPPLPVREESVCPDHLSDITNLCEPTNAASPMEMHTESPYVKPLSNTQHSSVSPSKMTVAEMLASKNQGPPTALDHKLLNCLLDKFDKSDPLIEVKTGGTVSIFVGMRQPLMIWGADKYN